MIANLIIGIRDIVPNTETVLRFWDNVPNTVDKKKMSLIPILVIISGTHKLFLILFGIRNMLEIVPDIAQSTHGIRNISADIRNVPTRPHMVLGMFLLPFPVVFA